MNLLGNGAVKRDDGNREVKSPINPNFRSAKLARLFTASYVDATRAPAALSCQASKATASAELATPPTWKRNATQFVLRRLKTLDARDADVAALWNALSTLRERCAPLACAFRSLSTQRTQVRRIPQNRPTRRRQTCAPASPNFVARFRCAPIERTRRVPVSIFKDYAKKIGVDFRTLRQAARALRLDTIQDNDGKYYWVKRDQFAFLDVVEIVAWNIYRKHFENNPNKFLFTPQKIVRIEEPPDVPSTRLIVDAALNRLLAEGLAKTRVFFDANANEDREGFY